MVKKDFQNYSRKNRDKIYQRIQKETDKLSKEETTKAKVKEITNKLLGDYGKRTVDQIDLDGKSKVTISKRLQEMVNEVVADRAINKYNMKW